VLGVEVDGDRLVGIVDVPEGPFAAVEQAAEGDHVGQAESVAKGRLPGAANIGMRLGRVLDKHKVGKHFLVEIADQSLQVHRDQARILTESELDGIYVIRTSVSEERLDAAQVVRTYKQLSRVERAFGTWKGMDIQVRPIRHWIAERVRAHILLCMLAYYVRWHLERAWATLLFRDEQTPVLYDPVAPSQRSAAAMRKASTQQLEDGSPVHSFPTLLRSLTTVCRNEVVPKGLPDGSAFEVVTQPTEVQSRALALAGATLAAA
jgi:hypothetical protein